MKRGGWKIAGRRKTFSVECWDTLIPENWVLNHLGNPRGLCRMCWRAKRNADQKRLYHADPEKFKARRKRNYLRKPEEERVTAARRARQRNGRKYNHSRKLKYRYDGRVRRRRLASSRRYYAENRDAILARRHAKAIRIAQVCGERATKAPSCRRKTFDPSGLCIYHRQSKEKAA